ncbi:D-alanine--poly(phosphoribitol) ligase [soil metagenome]
MDPLYAYLQRSAELLPEQTAIEAPHIAVTYRELYAAALLYRHVLIELGVQPGDRVGIYLDKSIDAVAAMHGIMMSQAAYVPVDPAAPARRNAGIHHDCSVRVAIVGGKFADNYRQAWPGTRGLPQLLLIPEATERLGISRATESLKAPASAARTQTAAVDFDHLAYILYTSGSTGTPKGVTLSHGNAVSFIDWCSRTFFPSHSDRCASHAPFHFDLSVLDIYMAMKHAATLVLVPDNIGKDPVRLAAFIAEKRITIWYSAPSILSLLAQFGSLKDHDLARLRLVLFAGEVFPIKHLKLLKSLVPAPVYYNLYGPTETNVCTYFRIPDRIPEDRQSAFPIGLTCSHLQTRIIDEQDQAIADERPGELIVRGPAVTSGYWNSPERNAGTFLIERNGGKWYRTGDLVGYEDGSYVFLGRRDRMIKKRGYRIELGEIEACLYSHVDITEAGVIARHDDEDNLQVVAFIASRNGSRLSGVKLKSFCSERLPVYMIPDRFHQCESLPHTSTGKVDYQHLRDLPLS